MPRKRANDEGSIRILAIPQQAIDLLIEEHKKHPDNPYMFPSPKTGAMYDPDPFRHTHEKLLEAIYSAGFTLSAHPYATANMKRDAAPERSPYWSGYWSRRKDKNK